MIVQRKQRMKLSKAQQELLNLMNSGWELGRYGGAEPRYSIQEGGLGRGGKAKTVNIKTVWALLDRRLIKQVNDSSWYPTKFIVVSKQSEGDI